MVPSAFGSDVAELLPDGSVALTCAVSKNWAGRGVRTTTRAEHPGTAVRWREAIYEVIEASPLASGGVRYRLGPWEERHAIRVLEAYDAPAEEARSSERVRRVDSVRERRLAIVFSPLIGHLPGAVQERLESEIGAPALAMTVVSALPLFIVGSLGLLSHIVGLFGGPPLFPWTLPLALSIFLAAESAVRIGSAWIAGHPMGSVAGVLFHRAALAIRKRRRPPAAVGAARPAPGLTDEELFRLLEPALSLLSRADQRELERHHDFDALKWGRLTAGLLFLVGALNVLASAAAFAGHAAQAADLAWLLAGTALCAEQAARCRDISAGRPRGSALGVVVRPFAARLLNPARAVPAPPPRDGP
ncbi:MAG: hypothetical protein LC780_04740 [Acidobacteria bacterium]|nr:hypothetical protein [Acidobacteriota bacterium]